MATPSKLPALDTFTDPAQLGPLQQLRQAVLKDRRGFFASVADGNQWFVDVENKLKELRSLQRAASPAAQHPHAGAPGSPPAQGRPRGADLNSHVTVRTVPTVKKMEGAPVVKVLNDPNRSMAVRPALREEPMRAHVVRPADRTASARPALRAPSSTAPATTLARVSEPLGLLDAVERKYRHASMMGDVFQLLRRAAVEARAGNSAEVEAFISQAEDLEKALQAELAHQGALSVVRPPSAPELPPAGASVDEATDAQSGG